MNDIEIIYEDEEVLVINKPAGLLVHSDGFSTDMTVADWFLARVPEAALVGEPQTLKNGVVIARPGVVHRLDKDTSGVMILAKTQKAFGHLKKQFRDRLAKKEYRAFVYGTMKEKWGTINRPIGRSKSDRRRRSAERGSTGVRRQAVTDWELILQNDQYAYLKFFPKTGRTHQIRVHGKAMSRPIVGDALYTPKLVKEMGDLGIGRLALHAHQLTLELPGGEKKTFTAPVPSVFEAALAKIAKS